MKLYVRNKIVSLGDSSVVVDENKQKHYKVKGKIFSPTHKKYICDLEGNVLYRVRNKFWSLFNRSALIYEGKRGRKVARVNKKVFTLNKEYIVLGVEDEIKLEGGFFSLKCDILKNGNVIGTVRREITLIADSFELEAEDENMPFLIALVVAIDNITDRKKKRM